MIIVHDTFICKPGQASKVAKMFKEAMSGITEVVNIVSQYENPTAYEQSFEKYMQQSEEMKKVNEKMQGYHDMYLTGSREIYKVW